MPTGAELLVRALEGLGVELVFGLPGVHNLAAWRALADSPIRLVTVRHEQTAAYAADGYARASGRLGVALTTTGPGAANTLAGVGEAWASRSPLLVVATDVATTLRRPGVHRGILHESTDQAAMFRPVVKAAHRARGAADVERVVAEAARAAMAAPRRPVYVELPTDLLSIEAGPPAGAPAARPLAAAEAPPSPGGLESRSLAGADASPSPADPGSRPLAADALERARELDVAAGRPLVWAGGGALQAEAGPAVAALAERIAAPVLTTYSARGLIAPDHPCAVGLPPHVPEAGRLWDEADLVIAVGSDLDGMMTQNWAMPTPPALLAINVDRADAGKNYAPDATLVGDARATVEALTAALPASGAVDRLAGSLGALRAAAWARLEHEHRRAIEFVRGVERALPHTAIVVCDMCIPGYWLAGFQRVPGPRKLQYPMGWGTLGFAFPAAIGAALAGGGPVVSVSGDAGFLYACGELATIAQERIPLTALIVDDGGYGMLRYDQARAGDPPFGVDLDSPDFAALAASFGIEAETVDGLGADFAAALARHVARAEPTVLVAKAALDPPPTTSPRWYRPSAA